MAIKTISQNPTRVTRSILTILAEEMLMTSQQ